MAAMTDGSITIAPFPWARRKKRSFDRIIGCYDPDTRPKKIIRFHRPNPPDLLVLKFVDLDEPAPAPHDIRSELRLPSVDDLKAALAFDREDASLLIHCHAGISRSTAIALAILSQRLGPGKESEAMDELLRLRPEAVPNLHIKGWQTKSWGGQGACLAPCWNAKHLRRRNVDSRTGRPISTTMTSAKRGASMPVSNDAVTRRRRRST